MSTLGLWQDIRKNPLVLLLAVLLHVVLIALLSMNLISSEVPVSNAEQKPTVKAVVVDSSKVDAELEKIKRQAQEEQEQKLAAENKRKQDAEKAQRELKEKQQQLAELETRKQKLQQEERQRQAQLKKKQAEEKRLAAEKQRQAEIEQQRKQAEAKRQAELKRQAEAAEKKRLAEEAEARRKQEEADLQRKLVEEEQREEAAQQQAERMRMLDVLRLQYVKLIEQQVERNWLRPATLGKDVSCEVYVSQTILGDVISVNLRDCAADSAFQQSIERAVWKASPLPSAPNPDVFDREIHFTFKPR